MPLTALKGTRIQSCPWILIGFTFRFLQCSHQKEAGQGENQLQQVGVARASAPFLLPLGSWASLGIFSCYSWGWSFLWRAHQWCSSSAKDPPECCSLQERFILDVSAVVLASHGLKNETKIGITIFFLSKEGRMSRNYSLFSLKKMQSVF